MAFGSWLKGLVGKATSLIGKVLPVAKKVVETVAPAAQKIGGLIGGKVGKTIQDVSSGMSGVVDKVSDFVSGGSASSASSGMVGVGGAGIRRIVPRLKGRLG